MTSAASANTSVQEYTVELQSVGTTFNKCLVDKVKTHLKIPAQSLVQETGFAYFGTFPTHPLFSQVPVLFLSELVPTPIADTYQVQMEIHLALASELRAWIPLKNPASGSYDSVRGLQVSKKAYLATREANGGAFIPQLEIIDIESCL